MVINTEDEMVTIKKLNAEYKEIPTEFEKGIINTKIRLLKGVVEKIREMKHLCGKKPCVICDVLQGVIKEIEG